MSTHNITEVILMSKTEMTKIILQLSSNTLLICSAEANLSTPGHSW